MRKPRFNIIPVYNAGSGKHGFEIHRKDHERFVSPVDYISEEAALADAELKKVELQEAMMQAAPPPELTASLKKAKEKKPRKAKPAKPTTMFPEACAFLEKAVTLIGAVSIKDAGEHIERLNKAMETIDNVRQDLSVIK